MVLTGRLVALAALGALLAAWSATALGVYVLVLVAATAVDLALAGRIAGLRLSRDVSAPVRLGERGETVLVCSNTGRRTVRGAGARRLGAVGRSDAAPAVRRGPRGRTPSGGHRARPDPPRRAAHRPGHGALVRAARARGPPASPRRARRRAGAARVRLAPVPAREAVPAAADRRGRAGAPARRGQRVRHPAHVRHRRRRTRHRLAGHGALARPGRAHLAPRARSARRARPSTPGARRRPASTTNPASTPRSTPACCSARWPGGPGTASGSSPPTPPCAPGSASPAGATCCPSSSARWPR